jgi:hypothetical protein
MRRFVEIMMTEAPHADRKALRRQISERHSASLEYLAGSVPEREVLPPSQANDAQSSRSGSAAPLAKRRERAEAPCPNCEARSRDWWKPDPEDPFWMLEAEDGEWLKNEHSLLGTRDPAKAMRFPTADSTHAVRRRLHGDKGKWWSAKPTEHLWAALSTKGGVS